MLHRETYMHNEIKAEWLTSTEARTRALRLIVVHRGQLEFQIKLLAVALVPLAQSARAQPEDNLADFFIIQRR